LAATARLESPSPAPSSRTNKGQLKARTGISRDVIDELSKIKGEPDWMREKRIKSLRDLQPQPIQTWGVDLSDLNFDDLVLYSPPTAGRFNSWGRRPPRT